VDLQNVPEQTEAAVRNAQQRLAEAAKARDEQRWPDAVSILATTRTLLNTADGAVATVNERLHSLNEAQRAPQAEIERTRFALRDAQRLAMAGRSAPEPRHAGPLDAAVERLDRAAGALTGRHPDYWHFLTELAAVRETAAQVVQAIREERGAGHR
jgi:chromosome segregation ATPase